MSNDYQEDIMKIRIIAESIEEGRRRLPKTAREKAQAEYNEVWSIPIDASESFAWMDEGEDYFTVDLFKNYFYGYEFVLGYGLEHNVKPSKIWKLITNSFVAKQALADKGFNIETDGHNIKTKEDLINLFLKYGYRNDDYKGDSDM